MPPNPNDPYPFPYERVSPELLAWAQQTFDMEEYLAGVREIEETGGHSFESLIVELEARARGT